MLCYNLLTIKTDDRRSLQDLITIMNGLIITTSNGKRKIFFIENDGKLQIAYDWYKQTRRKINQ